MAKDTFDKLRSILAERESSPYSQDRNKYQEITAQYDNDLYNSPEYKLGQDINNAKSDMWGTSGIGGLVERFSDNFFSTLGNTITGLNLSDTTNQFGKEMTRNATLRMANLPDTVEVPHDKGVGAWLNYFTDINRGAIPQVANVGGSALSMLIPTALTMIPAGRVAGMAMKAGKNFPAVGRAVTALENSGNVRQLLKDLGMGAISGQYEALAEKGATIDELEQMGLPHDEAVKQANAVYKENSALLTATNAVESALANPILRGIIPTFNVVDDVANGVKQVGRTSVNAQALRRFANMVPKPITTTGKVAGSIAGNMALNGYEEGVQNQIQSAHTPTIDEDGNFVWKDYQSINDLMNPYQWSDESIRAAEEGAVGAGGLALLGHGAGGISRRIRGQQLNDDNESTDPWENAFNTFKGQRMKNGDKGCVEAVTKIGAKAGNTWLGSQLEQSVVDGDTLVSNAQRDGLAVIAFDPANVERGDIILYNDTSKEGDDGLNVHSVIADGNGGIWGNSSSQHQVTSQDSYDMGDNLVPATIIKASAFNDGVVAGNEFEDDFDGEEDTASDFDTFIAKIGMQESGGNYDKVNPDSGASGKYQIMSYNWKPWAEEAGLDGNAEMTPENQEIVARHKLKQYYDKYGEKGALVAWYAGEDNAERYVKGETTDVWGREWTAPQDGAPSIQSYVDEALAQNVPNGGRKRKNRKNPNVNTNSTGSVVQSDNATLDDYLKLFDDGNKNSMTYADYERLINNASDDEVLANANKAVIDYTQEGNLDSFTQLTEMIGDDDVDGLRELAKEHARAITIDEQSPNDSEIDDTADVQNEPIKTFDFTEAINGLMEIANNGIQEQQVVARQALQSNAPLFMLNTYKQLTSGAPLEQADMDKMNAILNSPAYQDRVKNQLAGMYNSGNFDGVRTVLNQSPDNIPSQAEINQQSMGDNRRAIEQTQQELQERTNRRQVNDNAQQIARQQAESLNNNAPLTAQEQATANSVLNSADGVFTPQIKNELFNALRNGDNAGVRRVISGVPDNIPSQADVHHAKMAEIQESIGNARKNVNRAMAEKNLAGFMETLDEAEKEFMEFLDNLFYETGKGFIDVANGLISDVRRSRSEEEREVLINAIEGLATIAGKAKEYEARRNELRREGGVGEAEGNRPVRQTEIPSEAREIAKAYGLQLKERLKQNNVPINEQAVDNALNSEKEDTVNNVVERMENIAEKNGVPTKDLKEQSDREQNESQKKGSEKKNTPKSAVSEQESREGVESETRKETPSSENKPALNRKLEGQNSKAEKVKESGETATVSKAEIVGENTRDDFKLSRQINDVVRTSLLTIDQLVLSGRSQKDIERYVKNTLNLIDRESNLTDGEKQIIKDMLRSRSKIAINKAVKQIKDSNTKLAVDTSREGIQKQAKINREKQLELVKTEFPTATNIVQNEDSISFNLNDEKVRVDYVDRVIATEERKQAYRRDYGKEYTDDVSILGDTQTIDGEQVITLLNKLGNEDTLSHEAFHLAFRTALNKEQRQTLLDKYGNEEACAEAYRKLMNKSNARGTMFDMTSSIGRLFQKIWNFANSLFNVFNNGCMLHDAESIMYAIADGSIYELNEENEKGIVAFLHPALLAAWHGTPHLFDSFSTDFMGKGEGTQAHGWGLYFALNKDVSDNYRKELTRAIATDNAGKVEEALFEGKRLSQWYDDTENKMNNLNPKSEAYKIEQDKYNMLEQTMLGGHPDSIIDKAVEDELSDKAISWYKKTIAGNYPTLKAEGYLYQVDIPSTDTMLREDKPLKDQPKIIKLLDDYAEKIEMWDYHSENLSDETTGRELYKYIAKLEGSPKAASEYLQKAGIQGISYHGSLDGECCVIFNDKAVKILERNGEPVNNADEHGVKLRAITNADNQIKEVRKKYEGTDQWMKAPNGKPTNLTERQWLQVRTPNFKKWFGDWENDPKNASKVVDENGEPKVMYHGTDALFDVFKRVTPKHGLNSGDGFYFTESKNVAESYGNKVLECFLNIRKPFDTTSVPTESKTFSKQNKEKAIEFFEQKYSDWEKNGKGYDRFKPQVELLSDGGFLITFATSYQTEASNANDGVFNHEVVVFNPNQIKSATDNSGEFSTENDNIKYSRTVSNPNSAENLKKNGDTDTRLDKLPKVDYTKLNKTEKDIMKFGKALGVPVHFVTHYDPNYRGVFTHNGEIFINRKATVPAKDIFIHEFVHWLKASGNENIYDSLSACLENIKGVSHAKRLSEYRKSIFNGERMTNDEIIEEMICDAMSHTATANRLINDIGKINSSIAEKIVGHMKGLWDKFCNAVGYQQGKPINQQSLPNHLSANELAKMDAVLNRQLANIKGKDGKPVFAFKNGMWTVARNGKTVGESYNTNPISATMDRQSQEKVSAERQIEEVRKQYEGTDQWMKAPNGKPTNLTERQWLQVRTPNFKNWFGDWENDPKNASKVIDENGEPLVVYHGTPLGGFEVFNRELNYFTADKEYADRYQDPSASSDYVKGYYEDLGEATTYAVFLNIKKPFDTRNKKERKIFENEFYRQWGNGAPLSEKGLPDWTDSDDFRDFFDENEYDYDGLMLDEGGVPTENGNVKSRGISIVAFNSNQIKSATDNSGDFSTVDDNIKYSRSKPTDDTLSSDTQGLYQRATTALLKRLGFEKENDNVRVDRKSSNPNDLNIFNRFISSPSFLARYNKIVAPFVALGKQAVEKQEKLRTEFREELNDIEKVLGYKEASLNNLTVANDPKYKERKEALNTILFNGDVEGKEYTAKELSEKGHDKETIEAYFRMRKLLNRAYDLLDRTVRQVKIGARNMTDGELADLKAENPFIEIVSVNDVEGDKKRKRYTYRYPTVERKTEQLLSSDIKELKQNSDVKVVAIKKLSGEGYEVEYIQRRSLNKIKGYVPHMFHEWAVVEVDKDGKILKDEKGNSKFLQTFNTMNEAIKYANRSDKKGYYRVMPKVHEVAGASERAFIMRDYNYFKKMGKVEEDFLLTPEEATEIANSDIRTSNRGRFLGNLMKRKGVKNYEKDLLNATYQYLNQVGRYVALDPYKRLSYALYERNFGKWGNEKVYMGELGQTAKYIRTYINAINGVPNNVEMALNNALHTLGIGKEVANGRPALWFIHWLTYPMTILKLGMVNVSSALLNVTQLCNTFGAMGDISLQNLKRLSKNAAITYWKAWKDHNSNEGKLLWDELGLKTQLGMDVAGGYSKAEVDGLANLQGKISKLAGKSMFLFRGTDSFGRGVTLLTAYQKAIDEGKSHKEAIRYAKMVNTRVNFDYSVADANGIYNQLGAVANLILQFQKYPMKQLELFYDIFKEQKEMNKDKNFTNARAFGALLKYTAPYMALSGIAGVPFISLAGSLLGFVSGDDDKDLVAEFRAMLRNNFGDNAITRVLGYGALGIIDINTGSRIGVGDFLGGNANMKKTKVEIFAETVGGTTISTALQVGKQLWNENYLEALKALNPSIGNVFIGLRGEVRTTRGRLKYTYANGYEQFIRGLGFTPVGETLASELASEDYKNRQKEQETKKEAIDKFLANPSAENAKLLNDLGITPKSLKTERERKNKTSHEINQEKEKKKKEKEKKIQKKKVYSVNDYQKAVNDYQKEK